MTQLQNHVVADVTPTPERRLLKRLAAFSAWLFTGFGLFPLLFRRRGHEHKAQEIVVYSVHRAFFLWALILIGFVGAWVVRGHPAAAGAFGWAYIGVMLYTFLALLFDVGLGSLLLWTGIFLFMWLGSRYLEDLKHLHVLSALFGYLRGLKPSLQPGFAVVVSWLLLVPWIGSLFHTFTNGRKRFTPNEIDERFIGEGSELTDRSGLKFRTKWRDLLETLLGFGAGDLLAVDNNHNVIKRWENVLFLVFVWPRLDEVLHQRAAVVDNPKEDPVEVEEATRPRAA